MNAPWYAVTDPIMAICVAIAGLAGCAGGLFLVAVWYLDRADEIADDVLTMDNATDAATMMRCFNGHGADRALATRRIR